MEELHCSVKYILFFCISYEFMNIRGNIMLCIFSMHFENVPALQSLINQILLYSYRKVCAHFLIQLFDLSERRRSAGKKGLQGRWNHAPPPPPPPSHCFHMEVKVAVLNAIIIITTKHLIFLKSVEPEFCFLYAS